MNETLNNLIERISTDLNKACLSLAILRGYLHGNPPQERSGDPAPLLLVENKIAVKEFSREQTEFEGILEFTQKEISKMPKTFKNYFKAGGDIIYYRRKNKTSYEARYRRHGLNISRSAPTIELLKSRMLEAFKEIDGKLAIKVPEQPIVPAVFQDFADYYFEKYYKRSVAEKTYYNAYNRYKNHVLPKFKNRDIRTIVPFELQNLLDNICENGYFKTSNEVKSILNGIFDMAKRHNLIANNPIDVVFSTDYEQKHGVSLTKAEEHKLLFETAGTPYQLMFAVALYAGLRPIEYKTAKIEGKFIVARNCKRKKSEPVSRSVKKIPITKMLAPYLVGVDELKFYGSNRISERFRRILPNHRLYDLRTTFYTRCQECKVAEVAIKKYAGHKLETLAEAYTDLSDEFLLKEAEKIDY